MSTRLRFDHVLIGVTDLDVASKNFTAAGFTVFPGGTHVHGLTHNALIVFADGSYIELIAPTDPALLESPESSDDGSETASVLARFASGDGFVGYALHSEQIKEDVAAMQTRGLDVRNPVANGRLRPDGAKLAWRSALIDGVQAPFFITDDTPRGLRVQDDAHLIHHANGVTGFDGIVALADTIEEGTALYRKILGADPTKTPQMDGVQAAVFALSAGQIMVAAPTQPENEVARYQAERGNVPWCLSLQTEDAAQVGQLDLTLCHLAQIELVG